MNFSFRFGSVNPLKLPLKVNQEKRKERLLNIIASYLCLQGLLINGLRRLWWVFHGGKKRETMSRTWLGDVWRNFQVAGQYYLPSLKQRVRNVHSWLFSRRKMAGMEVGIYSGCRCCTINTVPPKFIVASPPAREVGEIRQERQKDEWLNHAVAAENPVQRSLEAPNARHLQEDILDEELCPLGRRRVQYCINS